MKVLFLKDVQGTATTGDVKEVALGFARNYLFPRRLATHVTPAALQDVERKRSLVERKLAKAKDDNEALAQQLGSAYVTLTAKAGEDGRLFGTITNQDVADALEVQYAIKLDKRKITFPDAIRNTGSWVAEVKLEHGVGATITLNVESE